MAYLQVASTEKKLEDITNAVLEHLTDSCAGCGITSDIIDRQSFACFSESPTHVTYRARLEGTSETDSDSLISLVEKWVFSSEASIIVTGVLMTVDSKCSVAVSSLSEGECFPLITDSTIDTEGPSSTDQTSSDSVAVIGGVVAVVIVLIIAITIIVIVIVVLVMKNRRGDLSIKHTEK